MKKLILSHLLLILIAFSAKSQITLETTMQAGDYAAFGVTKLTTAGYKYYAVNENQNELKLYNINHSVYQTISIPVTINPDSIGDLFFGYVTDNLFDNDNGIEYLMEYYDNNYKNYFYIFNEDGSTVFSKDSASLYSFYGMEDSSEPAIFNTDSGVKMMLSKYPEIEIYSLPGQLSYVSGLGNESTVFEISNSYPNPTTYNTTIPYSLPQDVKEGDIIIYDQNGAVIQTYKVDHTFSNLLINTSSFASGTYYYHLSTEQGVSNGKKLVVIK